MTLLHVQFGEQWHLIIQAMFTKLALPLGMAYLPGFGFVLEVFCIAICLRHGELEEE